MNLIEAKRGNGHAELNEAVALARRLPLDDAARPGVLIEQAAHSLDHERPKEALEFALEAQRFQHKHFGPTGLQQTRLSMILARALTENHRTDEARSEMTRGLEIARGLYGTGHPKITHAERYLRGL